MMKFSAAAVLFAAVLNAGSLPANPTLEQGYRQMYNLQFGDAHNTFRAWQSLHPADPMAPVSDAAAYLFSEFDRLHILQSEFFTDDQDFKSRKRGAPDPAVKKAFQDRLAEADRLADTALVRSAGDQNAEFAKILADGLRSDYLALIEKRYVASLSFMKTGRAMAEALLAKNPSYYDAYLAVGVENYMLGLKAAPVRWLLGMAGAETDKRQGIAKLKLTAEKGHYLLPFARLLLAVAALRDEDKNTARTLLGGLTREFPQNPLYAKELARLSEAPSAAN